MLHRFCEISAHKSIALQQTADTSPEIARLLYPPATNLLILSHIPQNFTRNTASLCKLCVTHVNTTVSFTSLHADSLRLCSYLATADFTCNSSAYVSEIVLIWIFSL